MSASSAFADAAPPPNPPHKGEGRLRRYARRAGFAVVALLVLDFAVGTAAVALGWEVLKR